MFVVPTLSFRLLYGLLTLRRGRRQILGLGVTAHPTVAGNSPKPAAGNAHQGYIVHDRRMNQISSFAKIFGGNRHWRTHSWHQLIAWLGEHKIGRVHACLEATGRYGLGIALALHEAGYVVSIVNPAQIRNFARTKLGRNKTDQVDAVRIREYP